MNKSDLKQLLNRNNIPEWYYNLDEKGETDQRVCLKKENNIWKVYFTERGEELFVMHFNSESEACDEILRRFKRFNIK